MVIEEVPRHQPLRPGDFALTAAAYAVAMAGGAVSSTVWISPQFLMLMVIDIWLVVGAVTFLLVRRAVAAVLIVATFFAVLAPAVLVQRAVLYERGVRHIAVVLDAHPILQNQREWGYWRYQVSAGDGPIPGRRAGLRRG